MHSLLIPALTVSLGLAAQAPAEVENPHEDPGACAACHLAGPPNPGPALPIVETCVDCHPDADMHPVGLVPDQVRVAEGWPLLDGAVSCWTCHTEPACRAGEPAEVPYLRGGPVERMQDFCYRCHDRETYTREDPHHPDERRGEHDSTCTACHTGLPETGAAPEDARLREVEGGVCATCHIDEPHLGSRAHLHQQVEAVPLAKVTEPVALPADGAVRCWSCHEVHDETPEPHSRWHRGHSLAQALRADAREGWELDDVEHWPCDDPGEHPPMLALPLEDGSLCHACHAEGGESP
jgi:hypothetical protein